MSFTDRRLLAPAPSCANRALPPLLAVAPGLLRSPANVLRLSPHPQGLALNIENPPQWRAHLLSRLRRQRDTARQTDGRREAPCPGYAIGDLHNVTMGEDIVEYLQKIDATLAPYRGRFLVQGGPFESLEGSWGGYLRSGSP